MDNFGNVKTRRGSNKESIFEHIPAPINQDKFIFSIFNGNENKPKMKNFHKSHKHNSNFEPVSMSSLSQYTSKSDGANQPRMQHFQYGQIAGGGNNNQMIYGSFGPHGVDMSFQPKPKAPPVKKIQETPDHFRYGEKDYFQGTGSKKMSNIFSSQERTSAEVRKKQREADETERDYHRYQQEKETTRKNIDYEKRKDHEMLKSYKPPWGKAGGGAPGERHERTQNVQKLIDDKEQTFPFGRPGGGAPLKTNSGNLRAGLPASSEIRFQKRDRNQIYDVIGPEGNADNFNRKQPFETNLDILAHETRERRNVLKRPQDMSASAYDPFGRPGAGAPLRDDTGNMYAARSKNLMRTVEGQNDAENRLIDTSLKYGTPRLKKPAQDTKGGFYGGFGRGGGGAPIVGNDGVIQTSTKQTFVKSEDGVVIKTQSDESIAQRGGGGAPMRDSNGNLVTNYRSGLSTSPRQVGDPEAKRKYLETLRMQVEQHENMKRSEKSEISKASVDTMSWIKQGKVGRPPVDSITNEMIGAPRMTSDIVRQRLEIDSKDRAKLKQYHEELDQHSKLHEETRQQDLLQERERSVEHARTMDTVWGKPGNGAPNNTQRRRKLSETGEEESFFKVPSSFEQGGGEEDGRVYKRQRVYVESERESGMADFPISPAKSVSDETVHEKTLRYVSREKSEGGQNIVQHIVAHEKISNPRRHQAAPFATDHDAPSFSNIQPVMPPRDYHHRATRVDAPVSSNHIEHMYHGSVEDDVPPPPPGTIKLSNAVRKKLMLRQHKDQ